MTSSKPYLLNAIYQWIVDNDCTPYVLVNAYAPDVEVPMDFAKDGQIVLNVAPQAVVSLLIDDTGMSFNARFGGIPKDIFVPVAAILGIYAKENGQGMMFDEEPEPDPEPGHKKPTLVSDRNKNPEKPSLRVVK